MTLRRRFLRAAQVRPVSLRYKFPHSSGALVYRGGAAENGKGGVGLGVRRQAIVGAIVAVAAGVSAACSTPAPAAAPARSASPSASVSASASGTPSPSLTPSPTSMMSSVSRPTATAHAVHGSARPIASSPLPAWAVSHQRPSPVCVGGCVTVGQPNLSSSVLPPYVPSTARGPQ